MKLIGASRLIRVAVLLAALIALGLAASSCGGDEDDGGSEAAGDSTVTTGGGDGEGTASGKVDPCSLLTTAEVGDVGVKASDPQPGEDATGGQSCNYGGEDLSEGVQVIVQPGGGQAYFDQSKALFPEPKPISGLGDQAVLDESNPQQVSVLVLQGDTVLSLGGSISAADAESLAEKALGRIGG